MDKIKDTRSFMRIVHRYLGYLMAGIMAVYAISGVILVYRDTDFLKRENHYEKVFEKNLTEKQVGEETKIKNFEVTKRENGVFYFKEGTYNSTTGKADYTKKELPFVWDKMTKLHKAKSENALSPLNTFFGICLLFFVISSFWMFPPKSKVFKRGMVFTALGIVIALLLTFL
ncbi:PepSY domain-containing protein [Epilithonimonas lactis]|uniref:Membrane protein n=1 Tax=Epilithonimonas lactis TaxID=421072 RepID=A0A085BF32_9FLAO|nr:PepSY domain-containing protein [Epilithonimonas lactis]KFC21077.1 membrane protein [Epilithonimonas lactis]SEP72292.1 hypothetical protein SAMN04488097_0437 [Epilithonimonas lactis]